MKTTFLALLLLAVALCRARHAKRADPPKEEEKKPEAAPAGGDKKEGEAAGEAKAPDAETSCKIEEMQIRLRGSFALGMVDSQDRMGTFNLTNTTMSGPVDEGKQAKIDKAAAKDKKPEKKKRLVAAELTPEEETTRHENDKTIKELQALLGNKDNRPINLFNVRKMELPNICQAQLNSAELAVLSTRSPQYIHCWLDASQVTDFTGMTYLDLPYLSVDQFAQFYACAEKLSSEEAAKDEYISPAEALQSPQALFNVVMGKHIPGVPISWLKFWVFVCIDTNYDTPEYVWKVVDGEPTYSKELTPEYTEKMKKLIDNVKALDIERKKVRSESGQVSANRFSRKVRRSHHKKHKKSKHSFSWQTTQHSLASIFQLADQKVAKEARRLRRLRKARRHHLKH